MTPKDDRERAFPADMELVAVKESVRLLEEMLCRPPAGLAAEEIEDVRTRRARELVRLARELEAEVDGRPKPRWRGVQERPERTAYRGNDGVYHPAPSMPDYLRHAMTCATCGMESARDNQRRANERGYKSPMEEEKENG